MKKILTLLAGATILTGCATVGNIPLDSKKADALMDKTLAVTVYKKPDFTAMTPTKAALGIFGALAMVSEGNNIIANNSVEDPAAAIASDLAAILETEYGAKLVAAPILVTDNSAAALAAAGQGSAQYVLDIHTTIWSMLYFPTDWTHYRLTHYATARLVDTGSKAVLAEGVCKYAPDTNVGAPTYDEMTGNNAQTLKQELALAARACVESLKAKMLSL